MLLFQKRFHDGLVSGEVTLTFRLWDKPHVKAGGRYRCHPIGVLGVDRVDLVRVAEITPRDAKRSGFDSRDDLIAYLAPFSKSRLTGESKTYRVELHYGGDGDRVEGALDARLDRAEVDRIRERLDRFDAKTPWTAATLDLIERNPRVAASRLAAQVGRETAPFKADVVRLKKLGLTQSFEVGYEISPRGKAYRAASATTAGGGSDGSRARKKKRG
jgi:hypothetical protein